MLTFLSTCIIRSTEPRRSLNCTISQHKLEMRLCVIKYTTFNMVCRFKILKGIKIGLLVQKLRQFLLILVKDFSTFGDFRNLNRTSNFYQMVSDTRQSNKDTKLQVLHTGSFWWFSIQWQYRREPNRCVRGIP